MELLYFVWQTQYTCGNRLKIVAKVVAKNAHQNQTINIEIVNNQYFLRCIKSATWLTRGKREISQKVYIKSVNQKMFIVKDWENIFNNYLNKKCF